MLVPFSKKTTPANYGAPSSPNSEGRMSKTTGGKPLANDSGPDPRKTMPAPPVDGAIRGHDTNYPRKSKVK